MGIARTKCRRSTFYFGRGSLTPPAPHYPTGPIPDSAAPYYSPVILIAWTASSPDWPSLSPEQFTITFNLPSHRFLKPPPFPLFSPFHHHLTHPPCCSVLSVINFLPTVHSRGNHNPSPRPESKNLAVRGFRSSNTGNVTGHSIVLVAGEPFPMVTEPLPLSAATCSCGGRESNPLILFPVIELPVFLVLPAGCNHNCNFSPNLVLSPMLLRLGMFFVVYGI